MANTYRTEAASLQIVDDDLRTVWMTAREGIPSLPRARELEDEILGHDISRTRVVCEQTNEEV